MKVSDRSRRGIYSVTVKRMRRSNLDGLRFKRRNGSAGKWICPDVRLLGCLSIRGVATTTLLGERGLFRWKWSSFFCQVLTKSMKSRSLEWKRSKQEKHLEQWRIGPEVKLGNWNKESFVTVRGWVTVPAWREVWRCVDGGLCGAQPPANRWSHWGRSCGFIRASPSWWYSRATTSFFVFPPGISLVARQGENVGETTGEEMCSSSPPIRRKGAPFPAAESGDHNETEILQQQRFSHLVMTKH